MARIVAERSELIEKLGSEPVLYTVFKLRTMVDARWTDDG